MTPQTVRSICIGTSSNLPKMCIDISSPLIHCGLATANGGTGFGQRWLKQWLETTSHYVNVCKYPSAHKITRSLANTVITLTTRTTCIALQPLVWRKRSVMFWNPVVDINLMHITKELEAMLKCGLKWFIIICMIYVRCMYDYIYIYIYICIVQ